MVSAFCENAPAPVSATRTAPLREHSGRGFDHGAYVPLAEVYPDADVPVLQLSMPTLDPRQLMASGAPQAPGTKRETT